VIIDVDGQQAHPQSTLFLPGSFHQLRSGDAHSIERVIGPFGSSTTAVPSQHVVRVMWKTEQYLPFHVFAWTLVVEQVRVTGLS
jgi:hypothetical protein